MSALSLFSNSQKLPDSCVAAKDSYQESGCCDRHETPEEFLVPYPQDNFQSASVAALKNELNEKHSYIKPKNVILVVADGMGIQTSYASRLYQGEMHAAAGKSIESYETTLDRMPHAMITRTHTVDGQTPDSSGTGTAFHTGVKTVSGVVNTKPTLLRGACPAVDGSDDLTPLAVELRGKKVMGIVSTARLTHATPAAAYSVSSDREFENDANVADLNCPHMKSIASQLTDAMNEGTVKLALGGGYKEVDDSDFLSMTHLTNRNQLMAFDFTQVTSKPVIGIFGQKVDRQDGSGHMAYENDRVDASGTAAEPSLHEMLERAVDFLSANDEDKGFFLTVEAGRVDHALHGGNLHKALDDTVQFEKAVQFALDKAGQDTLVIVTADHSHSLTFNGYCGSGSSVIGYCQTGDATPAWNYMPNIGNAQLSYDGVPMTVASFGNGPGAKAFDDLKDPDRKTYGLAPGAYAPYGYPNALGRDTLYHNMSCKVDESSVVIANEYMQHVPLDKLGTCLSEEDAKGDHTAQPALYGTMFESHAGDDIITRCQGPMSYLCSGTKDNTFIGVLIRYVLGVGVA